MVLLLDVFIDFDFIDFVVIVFVVSLVFWLFWFVVLKLTRRHNLVRGRRKGFTNSRGNESCRAGCADILPERNNTIRPGVLSPVSQWSAVLER